jgi:hypothetical protein
MELDTHHGPVNRNIRYHLQSRRTFESPRINVASSSRNYSRFFNSKLQLHRQAYALAVFPIRIPSSLFRKQSQTDREP